MSTELLEQPKTSEITVIANKINKGLAAFEERKEQLIELKEEASGLKIESIEDKTAINQVSTIRKKLKVARVEIQKEGKAMRDPLTQISRKISEKEKELVDIIEPTERELQKQEDWVESEKERIRQENEAKEKARIQQRIDRLAAYGFGIDVNFLTGLNDEQFEGVVENAKNEFEKEQARKAEEERLRREQEEKERQEREAEQARLKAEREELEKLRAEQREREEKIQAEQKRLADEQEKIRRVKINARQDELKGLGMSFNGTAYTYKEITVLVAEITTFEDERWVGLIERITPQIADLKEKEKIEQERIAKEREAYEKQRIERLQKEAAEKALREKEEADRRAKEAEAERLAQASDKVKFQELYNQLALITIPEMKSARSKKIAGQVAEMIENIQQHINANVLKRA